MKNTWRLDQVVNALNEHNIDIIIFQRVQEIMAFLGIQVAWAGSLLVISKQGHARFYVPNLDHSYTKIAPKAQNFNDFQIIEYAWANAKGDPFLLLSQQIYQDFICLLNKDKLNITFNEDYTFNAPGRNFGEGGIIPNNFFNYFKAHNYLPFPQELSTIALIKDPIDIEYLEKAHQYAQYGIDVFMNMSAIDKEILEQNQTTTLELQASIEHQILLKLAKKQPNSYAKAYAMVQCGKDTANSYSYNLTSNTIIKPGDLLFLELAVCIDGYWLDITRVTVAGRSCASKKQLEIFDIVKASRDAAINTLKAKVIAKDVYNAANQIFIDNQVDHLFVHALGHGTGFGYHDFGLSINKNSDLILEKGMVITIEPGVYSKEWGFGLRIEENVLITEQGFKILSSPQDKLQI